MMGKIKITGPIWYENDMIFAKPHYKIQFFHRNTTFFLKLSIGRLFKYEIWGKPL